jgi:hypothetical protein
MAVEQFRIVSSSSLARFEEKVSEAMADGWVKEGGPFEFMKTNSNGNPFPVVGQSMTKKDSNKPKKK